MIDRPFPQASPRTAPVAIVAAMREELAPLLRRARPTRALRAGSLEVHSGRLGASHALLAQSGEGEQRARAAATSLLEFSPVSLLLVLGTAGGLQPGLRPGVVVVADSVLQDKTALPPPDPALVERAVRAGAVRGTVVSAPRMLCSAAAKADAWAERGAGRPTVVDLESATFALEAGRRGVPCLVVRVVADPAEEDLPFDFNRFVDSAGSLRRSAVARHALLRPATLPRLLELRGRVRDGAERLARFTTDFLDGEGA